MLEPEKIEKLSNGILKKYCQGDKYKHCTDEHFEEELSNYPDQFKDQTVFGLYKSLPNETEGSILITDLGLIVVGKDNNNLLRYDDIESIKPKGSSKIEWNKSQSIILKLNDGSEESLLVPGEGPELNIWPFFEFLSKVLWWVKYRKEKSGTSS